MGSKNKAGYTATPVECGCAGAVFENIHLGWSSEAKDYKNIIKYYETDQPTNGWTKRDVDC